MDENIQDYRKHSSIIIFGWFSMISTDFLLHAGILYPFYNQDHSFLLDNMTAFRLIPLGYLSFLISAILLYWLLLRLKFFGAKGFKFGLFLGITMWGSLILGLLSIANTPFWLMAAWFVGQSIELAIAGYFMGIKLLESAKDTKTSINRTLGIYFICCLAFGIIIQNIYINF